MVSDKIKNPPDYKEKWIQSINYFFKNRLFLVATIIVSVLSYGFTLTNYSIGTDDTAFSRYFVDTELLSQRRFSGYLLHKFTGIFEFAPFWLDFLSLVLLFVTAVFLCALIKTSSKDKYSDASYIAFTCVFLSFPLINQMFIYMSATFLLSPGYFLTVVALIFAHEAFLGSKKTIHMIFAVISMIFAVGFYESFAVVYLVIATILVILNVINRTEKKGNIKFAAILLFKFLIILALGVVLNRIIASLILVVFNISPSKYSATSIKWGRNGSNYLNYIKTFYWVIRKTAVNFIEGVRYDTHKLFNLIPFVSAAILGVCVAIKTKKITVFFLFMIMLSSAFALPIVIGSEIDDRCHQEFAVIAGFSALVFISLFNKTIVKRFAVALIAILVLAQSRTLSQWFVNDYKRYQQDISVVNEIGFYLTRNYDVENKPVVFIGLPEGKYENLQSWGTNTGASFFTWSQHHTDMFDDSHFETYNFFDYHGYVFKRVDKPFRTKISNETHEQMTSWPKDGSVIERDDCIVVKLGPKKSNL